MQKRGVRFKFLAVRGIYSWVGKKIYSCAGNLEFGRYLAGTTILNLKRNAKLYFNHKTI